MGFALYVAHLIVSPQCIIHRWIFNAIGCNPIKELGPLDMICGHNATSKSVSLRHAASRSHHKVRRFLNDHIWSVRSPNGSIFGSN